MIWQVLLLMINKDNIIFTICTSHSQICIIGPSPLCGTNCDYHHRNGVRSLNISTGFSLNGADAQLLLVGHRICGMSSGDHVGFGGYAYRGGDYSMISTNTSSLWKVRRVQHELSHLYCCYDGQCSSQPCIMNGGFDYTYTYNLPTIWCNYCLVSFIPSSID